MDISPKWKERKINQAEILLMPANLPPEYYKAEMRYAQAKTIEEKIAATEELIRLAPKHKGTEKLLRMLKKRLAKLRREQEERKGRRVGGGKALMVKKEGAAQVVLIGTPNSGKSSLLRRLTGARPEVADYPFTTVEPVPGMMEFEDVQIQLVEAGGVVEGSSIGRGLGKLPLALAKSADVVALVLDATGNLLEQLQLLLGELEASGIRLNRRPPAVSLEVMSSGGIEIRGGQFVEGGEREIKRLLLEHGISNAHLVIDEPISLEELEEIFERSITYKPAFIIVTKCDSPKAREKVEELVAKVGERFKVVMAGADEKKIKMEIFHALGMIRVYTKPPDGEPAKRPLVLPRGSKVIDVARAVHKDFEKSLKFARVWGSTRFPGQQVPKDYQLEDRDIVELHI
ncbi:MAG: GTPase [Candidatus Hadarchaeales archaeon]